MFYSEMNSEKNRGGEGDKCFFGSTCLQRNNENDAVPPFV